MESYRDILERMRARYIEESGNRPEDVSDIGIRLRVMAGEVYRLQARTGFGRRPFLRRPAGRSWTCTGPRGASSGAAAGRPGGCWHFQGMCP